MIEAENLDERRTLARRRAVAAVLRDVSARDVWEARKEAKVMLPAAPAVVVWEETVRLLDLEATYRRQLEAELEKLEGKGAS